MSFFLTKCSHEKCLFYTRKDLQQMSFNLIDLFYHLLINTTEIGFLLSFYKS